MKNNIIILFGLIACLALPASADMGTDFRDHFNLKAFSSYNRDISSMIGMADFHTARGVTFPGFDIGGGVAAIKTSDSNISSKDYFMAPFLTAETQLPIFGLGVALRAITYDKFSSVGGGIKWHQNVALVRLSASLFYDRFGTDYYDGNHYSASASASTNVLIFTPYVGIGYDYGDMKTKHMGAYSGHNTTDGIVRYTAGVKAHPLPLLYVYGAYTYTKYNHGFQGGIGINFN